MLCDKYCQTGISIRVRENQVTPFQTRTSVALFAHAVHPADGDAIIRTCYIYCGSWCGIAGWMEEMSSPRGAEDGDRQGKTAGSNLTCKCHCSK